METPQKLFNVDRVYVKKAVFEPIDAPKVFREQMKSPEAKVELKVSNNKLEEEAYYEVIIAMTISGKIDDKEIFNIAVEQAGIFKLLGFTDTERPPILEALCPSILYPYLCQVISNLLVLGSFMPLHLQPINFDALYQQKLAQANKEKTDIVV